MVEGYFSRYGGRTILIGRFIGLVRALAPFIAGSSRLRYRNFAPFSILGTGLWSTGLILIGYFFSQSLSTVTKIVGKGLFVFAIVVGVVVGLFLAFRFLRDPENRGKLVGEMEKRRALRPLVALGRRLRPQFEFLGRRLTPGGLGLELTSLLGRALGRAVHPDRVLVGGRRRSGTDARRPDGLRHGAGSAGGLARAHREGGHLARLGLAGLSTRRGERDLLGGPAVLDGVLGPCSGPGTDRVLRPGDQELDRSSAPTRPARARRRFGLPQRPRGAVDLLQLGGDHPRR